MRIASHEALEKLKKRLDCAQYRYRTYAYPAPDDNAIRGQSHGETPGGIVIENLSCFSHIFHLHAKAAILLNESTHAYYTSKVIRLICAESHYDKNQLSEMFAYFAHAKAESGASPVIYEDFNFLSVPDNFTEKETQLVTKLKTVIENGLLEIREKYQQQSHEFIFFERIIHTLFNMRGYTRQAEANYLKGVAEFYQTPRNAFTCTVV